MGRRFSWILAVLVVGQLAVGATAVTSATETQSRQQGIAVELTATREGELLDQQDVFAPRGTARRAHAFRLYGRDGGNYIVYSDREDVQGRAVVRGMVVETADRPFDVIYAESVGVTTRGTSESLAELRANTSAYARELVRVRGTYRQVSSLVQSTAGVRQRTHGVLRAGSASSQRELSIPGRLARRVVSAAARNSSDVRGTPLTGGQDGLVVSAMGGRDWWLRGNATLDVAVVPGRSGNGTSVRLVSLSLSSRTLESPTAVRPQGEVAVGAVVSVIGYLSASSVSASGAVAAAADCEQTGGPNDYPICAASGRDVRVLAGVITDEDRQGERVIPVVGLSNRNDWARRRPVTGVYRVTGRVVNASEVDPTIPWQRALVVYRLERPPSAVPTGLDLRERRRSVVEAMQRQLVTDEGNWSDSSGRRTPAGEQSDGTRNVTGAVPVVGWAPVGQYAADWGGIRVAALGAAALIGGLLATIGQSVSAWSGRDVSVSRGLELAAWVVGFVLLAVAAWIGTSAVTRLAIVGGGVSIVLGTLVLGGRRVRNGE